LASTGLLIEGLKNLVTIEREYFRLDLRNNCQKELADNLAEQH
jgi:hypothetical protein